MPNYPFLQTDAGRATSKRPGNKTIAPSGLLPWPLAGNTIERTIFSRVPGGSAVRVSTSKYA